MWGYLDQLVSMGSKQAGEGCQYINYLMLQYSHQSNLTSHSWWVGRSLEGGSIYLMLLQYPHLVDHNIM
jgi:hypothetical protein